MKLTIWEKSILNSCVKADKNPFPINMEASISLEEKFDTSENLDELNNSPEKEVNISITKKEFDYIMFLLYESSLGIGLPKNKQSLNLIEKLDKIKKGENEI